ncbi:MAG: FAD-dependent oxidoreductase [Candidatus Dadabacteria bacterium]|nr:FAD-dependent oxidoreductase [Candidatus Dadabacteria bacterium]
MANEDYDLVIIGAGSAGLIAAGFAVQLGRRVALVEKHRIGGDCTWTGCVPSKTLLKAAKVAHEMRHADRYGLGPVNPAVDLKAVMAKVKSVVDQVYRAESPEVLRAQGIDVFLSRFPAADSDTVYLENFSQLLLRDADFRPKEP